MTAASLATSPPRTPWRALPPWATKTEPREDAARCTGEPSAATGGDAVCSAANEGGKPLCRAGAAKGRDRQETKLGLLVHTAGVRRGERSSPSLTGCYVGRREMACACIVVHRVHAIPVAGLLLLRGYAKERLGNVIGGKWIPKNLTGANLKLLKDSHLEDAD